MSLAAPSSEVDICNIALAHLKVDRINSIDPPGSSVEQVLAMQYHQVRRDTLRGHPWNFATKRVSLLPDPDNTPVNEFTHAYRKPSDWIRYAGRLTVDGLRVSPDLYQLEGDHILANGADNTAIIIRYIFDHTTVTKWDPLFISLFALNLAINIAPHYQGSEARVQKLTKQREDKALEAGAVDGQERPPIRIERSKFVNARRRRPFVADTVTRFD